MFRSAGLLSWAALLRPLSQRPSTARALLREERGAAARRLCCMHEDDMSPGHAHLQPRAQRGLAQRALLQQARERERIAHHRRPPPDRLPERRRAHIREDRLARRAGGELAGAPYRGTDMGTQDHASRLTTWSQSAFRKSAARGGPGGIRMAWRPRWERSPSGMRQVPCCRQRRAAPAAARAPPRAPAPPSGPQRPSPRPPRAHPPPPRPRRPPRRRRRRRPLARARRVRRRRAPPAAATARSRRCAGTPCRAARQS